MLEKNTRVIGRALLLILLVLSFTGCGGGDGGTENTEPVNNNCVLGASKIGDCTL